MGPSKPASKAEKARMDKLAHMPCPCCKQLSMAFDTPIEIHHLLRAGKRMGHFWSLPLCPGHHRGQWTASQKQNLHPTELVAISSGRKVFENVYGTEKAMWLQIQSSNGWSTDWPTDKIVRRKAA